jgi:hypothetical protein
MKKFGIVFLLISFVVFVSCITTEEEDHILKDIQKIYPRMKSTDAKKFIKMLVKKEFQKNV